MSGGAMQHNVTGMNEEYEYVSIRHETSMVINAGAPIIGESVSAIDDPAWPYEDEDLEVNKNPTIKFLSIENCKQHKSLTMYISSLFEFVRLPICQLFCVKWSV